MCTGTDLTLKPDSGLISTAYGKFGGSMMYALEGAEANAGSAVDWAKQILDVQTLEMEKLVTSVDSTGGVYFVPALSGLFTPYWNMKARSIFVGMTRGTKKAHMMRAVLEGVAFRAGEILKLMKAESGHAMNFVRVDGGLTKSNYLMKTLSNLTNCQIQVPAFRETTSLGAAMCAAMGVGSLGGLSDVGKVERTLESTFEPSMDDAERERLWA
jgi:glycerol kinase